VTFNPRPWLPIAWLLCAANLVAVWFASTRAEPWHASLHAGLAVLFGLWAQHLALRQRAA
jgi:hypothetical protein